MIAEWKKYICVFLNNVYLQYKEMLIPIKKIYATLERSIHVFLKNVLEVFKYVYTMKKMLGSFKKNLLA